MTDHIVDKKTHVIEGEVVEAGNRTLEYSSPTRLLVEISKEDLKKLSRNPLGRVKVIYETD